MPTKTQKPYTPSRRGMTFVDYKGVSKGGKKKSLLEGRHRKKGRNNLGRITQPQRGGGSKRRYRKIDFKRDKVGVPAKVVSIEYDPFRTAFVALLCYADGEWRYMLAPDGLAPGATVLSGPNASIAVGNAVQLARVPEEFPVHNIELVEGQGGKIVRSAGSSAKILSKEGGYAHVRLPSGEVRMINLKCTATIGKVSNPDHSSENLGKAGRNRWRGRRPKVRGVAKNAVDHPGGGGEGRTKGKVPKTRKGIVAKGLRTRNPRKHSSKFIVKRRQD